MFGFLLKVIMVSLVVVGGMAYISRKNPDIIAEMATVRTKLQAGNIKQLADVDANLVKNNISESLDKLITHSDRQSPVVLGVKVTNDSLNTLVDVIRQLPPDQVEQLKTAICAE